jgi:hypothetical protein
MPTQVSWTIVVALVAASAVLVSCGGSDADSEATPDPLEGAFREGIYTRTEEGKSYEIRFGVEIGRYVLLTDGVETRRGTHTLATTTEEGAPALAFIDEGEFEGVCTGEQALGVYLWEFEDNKLSMKTHTEECEQRRIELESDDWAYQGSLPTATPPP